MECITIMNVVLKLQNLFTKDEVFVFPSTESPDSSYGFECWIDEQGNSYGQCQFGIPFGFKKLQEYYLIQCIIKDKNNQEYIIFTNDDMTLVDENNIVYGTIKDGIYPQYELIGNVYMSNEGKRYERRISENDS